MVGGDLPIMAERTQRSAVYTTFVDHTLQYSDLHERVLGQDQLADVISVLAIMFETLVCDDTVVLYNALLQDACLCADPDVSQRRLRAMIDAGLVRPSLRSTEGVTCYADLERFLRESGTHRRVDDAKTAAFAEYLDSQWSHHEQDLGRIAHAQLYDNFTAQTEALLASPPLLREFGLEAVSRELRAFLYGRGRTNNELFRRSFFYEFADLSRDPEVRVGAMAAGDALYHAAHAATLGLTTVCPANVGSKVAALRLGGRALLDLDESPRSLAVETLGRRFRDIASDSLWRLRASDEFWALQEAREVNEVDAALERYLNMIEGPLTADAAGRGAKRKAVLRHGSWIDAGLIAVDASLMISDVLPASLDRPALAASFAWWFVDRWLAARAARDIEEEAARAARAYALARETWEAPVEQLGIVTLRIT